jgi:hypothetical protein
MIAAVIGDYHYHNESLTLNLLEKSVKMYNILCKEITVFYYCTAHFFVANRTSFSVLRANILRFSRI